MVLEHAQFAIASLLNAEAPLLVGLLIVAFIGGILGIWALKCLLSMIRMALGFAIGAALAGLIFWLLFSSQGTALVERFLKPETEATFHDPQARHVEFLCNLSERPAPDLD